MLRVNLERDDHRWESCPLDLPALCDLLLPFWAKAPQYCPAPLGLEASLLLTNDQRVQGYNKAFRGQDKPTNVLSFAALDAQEAQQIDEREPLYIGDFMMAIETLEREAKTLQVPLVCHAEHLVFHGLLHLMGYDHQSQEDADIMEAIESQLMQKRNWQDPYLG